MNRRTRTSACLLAAAALVATTLPAQAQPEPERPGATAGPSRATARAAALDADALAAAMDVPAGTLLSADYGESDPRAFAVSDGVPLPGPEEPEPEEPGDPEQPVPTLASAAAEQPATGFPSRGSSFLVMSTGDASHAMLPNTSSGLSTDLGGSSNAAGEDLAQLHLELDPPDDARCFAFDVAFLSEEYPEYVGSDFNDAFTAQLGDGYTEIVDGAVEATANFAQDVQGNALTINTVFGMEAGTGTTYDGGTSRLRAGAPVLGATVDVYLTVQDLGDSAFDSAVFLDNFFWSTDLNCRFGSTEDSDGDGLLDEWERDGLTMLTGEGQEVVDLPAMGADPAVPDVFVEIDHMADGSHSHAPDPAAIAAVVDAFDRNGVHLHVDHGPTAPLTYGTAATWGDLSGGDAVPHREHLGDNGLFGWFGYRWAAFDGVKEDHFDEVRAPVFHYNVWAHDLSEQLGSTSGMSRGSLEGASDFVVSLGSWQGGTGSPDDQAGTFMHELGHNLGLGHGGDDHVNLKPNYLSVMNYHFQDGLAPGSPQFDYSGATLPDLDEEDLHEADGIGVDAAVRTSHEGCGRTRTVPGDAVDFNCDGDTEDVLSRDVNDDGDLTVLRGARDWGELMYTGGAIGRPGALVELPAETVPEEPELTEERHEELSEQAAAPAVAAAPTVPAGAVVVGTAVTATAPFTVTGGAAGDVVATWSWGDGTTTTGAVGADGPRATGTHAYTRPGLHQVQVTLTGPGGTVTSPAATVVVVDPAAGGLHAVAALTPQAGAAPGAPAAQGPAAVVLGASWAGRTPRLLAGTLVEWPAARLRVVATDADWLVVDGATAVLESAARVNGTPGYRQRVTVTGGRTPTVRVQVWDPRVGGIDLPAARVLDTGAGTRAAGLVSVGR